MAEEGPPSLTAKYFNPSKSDSHTEELTLDGLATRVFHITLSKKRSQNRRILQTGVGMCSLDTLIVVWPLHALGKSCQLV